MKRFVSALVSLAFTATMAFGLTQSSIPPKFGTPWGSNAGAAYIRSIPAISQIGIQNCAASLPDGFPPLTFVPATGGGCPPFGQDFNGILKQITQWNQWQSAGGPVFYDSAFSTAISGYPKGAILSSAVTPGTLWMSTVDNNTTNPDALGAGWVQAPGQIPIGMPVQSLYPTVPTGYVSANGLTVGNAASNATNRANADTLFLFSAVWNGCPNTQCPIFTSAGSAGTRGATAAADFAANMAIAVQNLNGTALMGADSQNGTTSSNLVNVPVTSGGRTVPGSILGENLHALTAAENGPHTHTNSLSDPGHVHGNTLSDPTHNHSVASIFGGTGTGGSAGGSQDTVLQHNSLIISFNATGIVINNAGAVTGLTINNASSGSGTGHNTVPRSALVYWDLKL